MTTTENRMARLAHVGEILLILALLAAAAAFGGREVRTPDTYFHLTVGGQILDERAVPRTQRWLAFHRDRPFVDPEWGYQVAAAAAVRAAGGLEGLLALRLALVAAATAAVYVTARRAGVLAAGGAALGFLVVAEGRFLDAPEMASIALAALFVAALEARERFPRLPWALPLGVLAWANVHGFYLLGIVLIAAYAIGDLAHRPRQRALLFLLALSLAAPLANPYGLAGALYPFHVAGDAVGRAALAERIVELRSPLFDPVISTIREARAFQVGLAVALLAAGLSVARGFRLERAAAIALAGAIAVPYIRNVGLFAAVAAPLAALASAGPLGAGAERLLGAARRLALGRAAAVACGLAAFLAAWSVGSGRHDRDSVDDVGLGPRFSPAIVHDTAIDFYLASGLPKVVWTDIGTGHALVARGLAPAISGHTDLYPRELFWAYGDAIEGRIGLAQLLERYPAEAILADHRRLAGSALLAELLEAREWVLVHLDARDAIWVRDGGPYGETARRLRLDLDAIARAPERHFAFVEDRGPRAGGIVATLRAAGVLGTPAPVPRDRLGAAEFLLAAGKLDAAERLARAAAALRPGWPPCEYLLGLVAKERGDHDAAKAHFRAALRALPGNAYLRHSLGLLHLRLRELGRAEEELEAAVRLDPGNVIFRENLRMAKAALGKAKEAAAIEASGAEKRFHEAVASAGEGRIREAERLYREAIALNPRLGDAYFNLGNLLFRDGRLEEALLAYRRACELGPRDPEARYNLGITLRDLGRPDEARRALEEALAIEPRHGRARQALAGLEK